MGPATVCGMAKSKKPKDQPDAELDLDAEAAGEEIDLSDPDGEELDADDAGMSDAEVRDELPQDLDVTAIEAPYEFPNNNRRRVPGVLYLLVAAGCIALWLLRRSSSPVLVNNGLVFAAAVLAAFGVFHLVSGWDLDVDEERALVFATKELGFPVGHASAQMGWRGLLSRPTWRVLAYSAENPPLTRALVLVDGVDGAIVDSISEDNPEDWSEFADILER